MCKHVLQRQLLNYKKKVLLTWFDELLVGNKLALFLVDCFMFAIFTSRVEYDYEILTYITILFTTVIFLINSIIRLI